METFVGVLGTYTEIVCLQSILLAIYPKALGIVENKEPD
jgi:hypothetical protein